MNIICEKAFIDKFTDVEFKQYVGVVTGDKVNNMNDIEIKNGGNNTEC